MKIEQSELKDLKAVVTVTIEPADYQATAFLSIHLLMGI